MSNRRSRPCPRALPGVLPLLLGVLSLLLDPSVLFPQEAPDDEEETTAELRIDSPYDWIERSRRFGAFGGRVGGTRGDLEFGPGPAEVAGARFRFRVSSPLSLEVGLGGGNSDRFVIDPLAEGGPRAVEQVPLRWLSADAAVQLALTGARTWNRLQPYVLLGTGLIFGVDQPVSPREVPVDPPDEGENGEDGADGADEEETPPDLSAFRYRINTAPVFQAGVGTELHLSGRLGVSLEARDLIFRLRSPDGFFRADVLEAIEEAAAPAPRESQWTNNLHLTLTLWYYF